MKYSRDWTTPHAKYWQRALAHLAGKEATGLEIGCLEGRSSNWFVSNILTHQKSRLVCVDPWQDGEIMRTFTENTKESGAFRKISMMVETSQEADLASFAPYDFVYVDGGHMSREVLADAFKVWPLLKIGGVLIFDDYLWPPPGVSTLPHFMLPSFAIENFCVVMGGAFKLTHRGAQVIGTKKQS